ncbi:histidine phosphatase family protein [Streptomyces sp. NBC_00161]
MMSGDLRRLVVLRHAKSAWPPDVADSERPLAPRGRRDAPAARRWLREAGCVPDLVRCSSAQRTRQTWRQLERSARPSTVTSQRKNGRHTCRTRNPPQYVRVGELETTARIPSPRGQVSYDRIPCAHRPASRWAATAGADGNG